MKSTRHIVRIDHTSSASLTGLRRISTASVNLSESTPWEQLPVKVPARLTISDKIEDGVRLHTAQLIFRTCEDVDSRERMVYRATCADGRQYLIGTNDRPYPITNVSEAHADNMTDNQLQEVTVSYTSAARIPYIQ